MVLCRFNKNYPKLSPNTCLTYDIEFVVFLVVLEKLSCPWAETAHRRHLKVMSFGYKCFLRGLTKTPYYVWSWLSYNINVTVNILFKASIFLLLV